MLQAKFQERRTLCSGVIYFEGYFTMYENVGHLGHVTKINFINVCPLFS